MTTTRAVIFDFGGTLFSYEGTYRRSGRARLLASWVGFEGDDLGPVVAAIRGGVTRAAEAHFAKPFYLHRDFFADCGRFAAEALGARLTDAQAAQWAAGTNAAMGDGMAPRYGVHETLQALRDRSIHVGAASNADCDQFQAMVDALDVRHLFDSLLCSEDAQSCKPDQRIFQIALERAGCQPHEAIFVGDTPDHDIVGAERAGMRTLLIEETTPLAFDRGRARDGQAVIRELREILDHL